MPEYRVTRRGRGPVSARNGHYITAPSPREAVCEASRRFPRDPAFDVQLWKVNRVSVSDEERKPRRYVAVRT